jgi:hypothetical protein
MRYRSFADLFVRDDTRSSELIGQPRTTPPRWFSSKASTSRRIEHAATQDLRSLIPYMSITSDLGVWDQTYHLQFSHFLVDDPSLAVFSRSQGAPIPVTWRSFRVCPCWRSYFRCRWKGCRFQVRRPCIARVVIGSRGRHKLPPKAIRCWSAADGFMLADWDELCQDYFGRERINTNTSRSNEAASDLYEIEGRRILTETGALGPTQRSSPTIPACVREEYGASTVALAHSKTGTWS